MDKNKDGKLSAAELVKSPMKDFLVMMDDNKNGALDRNEWQNIQSYMRTGKNAVLAIKPGGQGDITGTHVAWKNDRGAGYVASPLAYEGRLYLVKDGGFVTCYDSATGRILYEKQRLPEAGDYYASPVAAGGRIYVCSGRGRILVLKPGDKPDVIANNNLGETIFATPAFSGSAIYVRSGGHLWAFGEK
jgi:outer membrane protein assembly factor BamB